MLALSREWCATSAVSEGQESCQDNNLRTSTQTSLSYFMVPSFAHQGLDLHTADLPWLGIKMFLELWDFNNQDFNLLLNYACPSSRGQPLCKVTSRPPGSPVQLLTDVLQPQPASPIILLLSVNTTQQQPSNPPIFVSIVSPTPIFHMPVSSLPVKAFISTGTSFKQHLPRPSRICW